jgi:hypothetical protein
VGELELRDRLQDQHAVGADFWFYNDFEQAREEARRSGKPLFVTFRCVPCLDCKAFDAEVAQNSDVIRYLATTRFVPVRLVEMKGVDLSQFQFDYDLNWAAMFLNADGTVYGRYGTQSAEGADAYNSIESLRKAMRRVLELHEKHPENAGRLAGKRGDAKPYRTALEMPGLDQREKLRGRTERNNCIHCHNIHDAENRHAQEGGTFTRDSLWRYPLPDNIGLRIDPMDGRIVERVLADSPASRAGLRAGDVVLEAEGQAIISIADIQWVLHHIPNREATVGLVVERDGRRVGKELNLQRGWKETDIAWRGSLWSVSPRLRVWAPEIKPEEKAEHGLKADQTAMLVRWINQGAPGGKAAHEAGLREGDVIVGMGGKPLTLTEARLQQYIKLNYRVGQKLAFDVLREGNELKIEVPLVE